MYEYYFFQHCQSHSKSDSELGHGQQWGPAMYLIILRFQVVNICFSLISRYINPLKGDVRSFPVFIKTLIKSATTSFQCTVSTVILLLLLVDKITNCQIGYVFWNMCSTSKFWMFILNPCHFAYLKFGYIRMNVLSRHLRAINLLYFWVYISPDKLTAGISPILFLIE